MLSFQRFSYLKRNSFGLRKIVYLSNQKEDLTGIDKQSSRTEEGLTFTQQEYRTERKETIKKILNFWEKDQIILIRSPPYTGKTALCQLLERNLLQNKKTNQEITRISFLGIPSPKTPTLEQAWITFTGKNWDYWFYRKEPTFIIMDESQNIYTSVFPAASSFWQTLKRLSDIDMRKKYPNLRVLAFSAYGDRPGTSEVVTPFSFPASYGVELIFCTKNEFDELITNFNLKNKYSIQISEFIAKNIYDMTGGHIGLIKRTLEGIEEHVRDLLSIKNVKEVTDEEIAIYLVSRAFHQYLKVFRASPPLASLTTYEKIVLQEVLKKKIIEIPDNEEESKPFLSMMKKGILRYVDKGEDKDYKIDFSSATFISPLIESLCFYSMNEARMRPENPPDDFDEFILQSLQRLKPSVLLQNKGKDRPLEGVWNNELYQAMTSLLPRRNFVHSQFGREKSTMGLIDFYVNGQLKWVIEILIDGDRLKIHEDKFKPKGLYSKIPANKIAIIDFRNESKQVKTLKENFWYVMYNDNFSQAKIIRKGWETPKIVRFYGDLEATPQIWVRYGKNKDKIDLVGVSDVADLRRRIRNNPDIGIPATGMIVLFKGETELKPEDKIASELLDGIDELNPLNVIVNP